MLSCIQRQPFSRDKGQKLRAEGYLFMLAPLLAEALADTSPVRIALNTTWIDHLGFRRARGYLPEAIQSRFIGTNPASRIGSGLDRLQLVDFG